MATKRKGKKVNRSAYSRKKVPRKMRGNKRKSLKNKTSSRKRMNRKAGMDVLLRGGGAALGTLLHGKDSQKEAEDTRQCVEELWNSLNEQSEKLGKDRVRNVMESVFRFRGLNSTNSVEEMRQRMYEDTSYVPRLLKSILEETDELVSQLPTRPSTPPTEARNRAESHQDS